MPKRFPLPLLALAASLSGCASSVLSNRYPPIGEFIEIDDQRLHLVDAGRESDLPPLLLVHGANSNLRDFESSIAPRLRETTRVISIDRPGFGHSPASADWLNPSQLANLLLQAAEQRGAKQPIVVGHSWGGSVAMAALVDHGERISGAVALSGVAGHWAGAADFKHRLADWPVLGPLFAYTLLWPVGGAILDGAIGEVLAPNPVPEGYVENIAAPLALRGPTYLANSRDMRELSEWLQAFSPRYDEIDQPLLFLHGADDTLVPWFNHGRRFTPIVKSAEAVLLEGVGHSPHHAKPEIVSEHLLRFAAACRDKNALASVESN